MFKYQRKVGSKSYNLTYCSSLQPVAFYNFSEIDSTFLASFWCYVTGSWKLGRFGSVYLMRGHVHIFLLKQILVKNMSRKFHVLCAKHFGNSAKDRYFLRFHIGSRNMFVNASQENWFPKWFESILLRKQKISTICVKHENDTSSSLTSKPRILSFIQDRFNIYIKVIPSR